MDEDKKDATTQPEPSSAEPNQAPADALSMTPDELADAEAVAKADNPTAGVAAVKKVSPLRRLWRKLNIYLLMFVIILIVSIVIVVVVYFNSTKAPTDPSISSQNLTTDSLKQLSNTNVSVGDKSQTLTIQGNTIINGETLARGSLSVAGDLQTGGSTTTPNITVSGTSNLGTAQINSLQVAGNTAIQGEASVRNLIVAGNSTFSGAMTASQITVTNLVLSGNAVLSIPNHIRITGPSPSRSINSGILGAGGSASVNGSDTAGTLNVNTGNNPQPGCFVRINFASKFSNQPRVVITPVGADAGQTQFYSLRDVDGFSICTATAAPANKAMAYDYFITN